MNDSFRVLSCPVDRYRLKRRLNSESLSRVSRGHALVPKRERSPVKILLTDAALLDNLVAYLVGEGCVVEQVGPNLVEASRLSSIRHDQARMEIDLFLQAWKASHPAADVRLLD
jgi:hypothetical protein